jgi:hypothetical protein
MKLEYHLSKKPTIEYYRHSLEYDLYLHNLLVFFFFLVAPTRGSVLPFRSIGLIYSVS